MPQIAFLTGDARLARHDNHVRLPRAFRAAGWEVAELPQASVTLTPAGVRLGDANPEAFDLIWPLGMGRLDTFLDRMQLLQQIPHRRFIVPVDALTYWHAKYAWWRRMPETYAASDPDVLKAELARGGDWVIKPAAGSYGRGVQRIRADAAGAEAVDRLTENGRRYALLQRYVAEIERGEKRTLVAGGRLIGSYLRQNGADPRTNLATGASAHPTALNRDESALVSAVVEELRERGIGFAAVDVAHPYLIEVNLANPGGLATLETLYGRDPAPDVVRALIDWIAD